MRLHPTLVINQPGPYDVMRKNANRMRILSVYDLPHASAVRALALLRADAAPAGAEPLTPGVLDQVVRLVGGRTAYLSRCARARDPLEEARFMVRSEREWLMSQCVPALPVAAPRAYTPPHNERALTRRALASVVAGLA